MSGIIRPRGITASDLAPVFNEVEVIEHHFHTKERWLGGPEGESFGLSSGADEYGSIVQLLDAGRTPISPGKTFYDMHRILVTSLSNNSVFTLQFIWAAGTTTPEQAIANDDYSELMVRTVTSVVATAGGYPVETKMPKIPAGTRLYARCKNILINAVISFFIGVHEY